MKVYLHFGSRAAWQSTGRSLMVLAVLLLSSGWMLARTITGTVVDETGIGLPGVNIIIEGTSSGTVTDIDGSYSISANDGDVLIFSFTGYQTQRITVAGQSRIDLTILPDVNVLDEVVVTGYNQQRKGDITGAVAVISTEELTSIAATSVNQQLEGRATGVMTSTSGAAGDGTNIRIRGISSFTSNDPLIIVDGVPQFNNFLNNINPNDIASVQILKDASAASIYGTRALNGVVIITTKRGKTGRPQVTYDAYYGVQSHERGFDDILITNSMDYMSVFLRQYTDQGLYPSTDDHVYGPAPGRLPTYIFPNNATNVDESTYSYPDNLIMRANQQGTNWWDEVFDPAPITDHTLAISGGTDAGTYRISANYQSQEGTMTETYFRRYAIRANSQWKAGKVTFGQNLNISRVESVGVPGGLQNEQSALMQIIKMQPIIPVYDVSGVNFAGGKSNGLSNGTNPVAMLKRGMNNKGEFDAAIGNLFAEAELLPGLKAKTNFGINYSVGGQGNFNFPTFENSEPTTVNSFNENLNRSFNWVWTNTLNYNRTFANRHNFNVLVGYESLRERFRQIQGSFGQFFLTGVDSRYLSGALANPDTRQVASFGSEHTLLSTFAKVDYDLEGKYLISGTIRRDGSSRFGPENRYGIFPAASVGWRVSAEPFMANIGWLTDMKVRFGWGKVGNESIGDYRYVNQFGGGPNTTFYDIRGANNSIATGYTATSLGDPNTGWEEKTTTNFGLDVSVLDGKLDVVLDLYTSTVEGLLFNPALPTTAGTPSPPFVNVGAMENNGYDLAITWRPNVGQLKFNVTANISQYRNEIVRIDGETDEFFGRGGQGTRVGIPQINRVGFPVASFFGYQSAGIWQSQAEIDAANAAAPGGLFMPGAQVGGLRWGDVDGFDPETNRRTGQPDGIITDADLTIIGNPHPDVTAGLNIGVQYKNFDFTAFFFGSFGNDILNTTKQFTIFRQFNTNASTETLNAWTPQNTSSTIPALNINDTESRKLSSFYVEDGSYVRLRQLQLGYTLPNSVMGGAFSRLRFYAQAQNLFTFTNYSGLDPALSSFGLANGDADDLFMGVDYGNYPTTRIIMFGVSAAF